MTTLALALSPEWTATAFVGPRRITIYTRPVPRRRVTPYPFIWGLRGKKIAREAKEVARPAPPEQENAPVWEEQLRQENLSLSKGTSKRLSYGWQPFNATESDETGDKTPEDQTPPDLQPEAEPEPLNVAPLDDLEATKNMRPLKHLSALEIKNWELRMSDPDLTQSERATKLNRDVRTIRRLDEKSEWTVVQEIRRRFLEQHKS
jgi:hypothetical protein